MVAVVLAAAVLAAFQVQLDQAEVPRVPREVQVVPQVFGLVPYHPVQLQVQISYHVVLVALQTQLAFDVVPLVFLGVQEVQVVQVWDPQELLAYLEGVAA